MSTYLPSPSSPTSYMYKHYEHPRRKKEIFLFFYSPLFTPRTRLGPWAYPPPYRGP